MRVRLKTLYAGPAGIIQPGELAALPDQEASHLIERGYASPEFNPKPVKIEATVMPSAPETTQRTTARARPVKK